MDLTVTASTDNTITLVWGAVQGPIDHYKVTYTSSSGITTEVKNQTADDDDEYDHDGDFKTGLYTASFVVVSVSVT